MDISWLSSEFFINNLFAFNSSLISLIFIVVAFVFSYRLLLREIQKLPSSNILLMRRPGKPFPALKPF